MTQEYQLETILAHAGINSDEATGALASPIHFSTTYQHPEFGHSTGFDYTRTKNPTRATVERTIAAQKMVRLETERLGIPEIPLYVKETGSSNCVALYNNEENEIWYAPEHLTSQTAEEEVQLKLDI